MNDNKANHSPKMSRKTRTKTRKPKFLSLRTELSPESSPESVEMTRQHQLNLFPLHPENLFEERDTHVDNVAYFFDTDGGATLNGLLGGGGGSGGGLSSAEDSLTQSLPYSYGGLDSDEGANLLARTALRCQGRDARKEKWVIYSEVVEKKEDEVSSCESKDLRNRNQKQGLSLKLDYQEILNAWSDKGPLYIDNECPQTVPDLHDECSLSTMLADSCLGGNAGVQRVPDDGSNTVEGVDGEGKKGQSREARVLRYKEKRQSRLFSKRIRYEVRKLNAEKRPRMKGRFVKRN